MSSFTCSEHVGTLYSYHKLASSAQSSILPSLAEFSKHTHPLVPPTVYLYEFRFRSLHSVSLDQLYHFRPPSRDRMSDLTSKYQHFRTLALPLRAFLKQNELLRLFLWMCIIHVLKANFWCISVRIVPRCSSSNIHPSKVFWVRPGSLFQKTSSGLAPGEVSLAPTGVLPLHNVSCR
jgi:hypothetical protein